MLLEASRATEETFVDALAELCDKRIIREQKAGVFDFTHDKLRDMAVAQVGGIHKRLLSRHIAEAYEAVYGDRLDEFVGELAVVYECAGEYAEAISYYQQAAQAENRRGAYKRAETYLEKALALIDVVAEHSDFATVELTLQLSLANVARVIRRNTVPKARAAFARALQLSEATGDLPGRFQALFGLAQYYMTDADLAQAGYFCQESIAVAEQIDDEASLIRASLMFGFICLIRGEFCLAKENLERVCSHYTGDLAEVLTTLQGEDTGVMANIYLSCVLWFLGYAEQSDEKMAVAQAIARERGLPINLAFVCFYQMMLSQIKHDIPAARRFANRLVAMSEHYDIGFALIAGRVGQAYVGASLDPDNRRLTESFEQLLATYHEQVSVLSQPFFLALKARLLMAAERYEEAQAALTQAIALMDAIDDRYSAAEVYRLQGELWSVTGGGDPEAVYLQAIALAGEQQAKMHQIRAAVSLCRLWQRHGKHEEAHRLLSAIYDWFSEGFATTELQEARALLDELAPS